MCPNPERFLHLLAGQNLTQEQKLQFIHTLYAALEKLADRQFGMDAVSLAAKAKPLADSFTGVTMPVCKGASGALPESTD